MLVSCPSCSAKFNVPDAKVAGKRARMKCKKCGDAIPIDGTGLTAAPPATEAPATHGKRTSSRPKKRTRSAPRRPPTSSGISTRWRVSEPSGKEHEMSLGDVARSYADGRFEPGTLVCAPGKDDWLPPYDHTDVMDMVSPPDEGPPVRPPQPTFSENTVTLGAEESAKLTKAAAESSHPPQRQPANFFGNDDVDSAMSAFDNIVSVAPGGRKAASATARALRPSSNPPRVVGPSSPPPPPTRSSSVPVRRSPSSQPAQPSRSASVPVRAAPSVPPPSPSQPPSSASRPPHPSFSQSAPPVPSSRRPAPPPASHRPSAPPPVPSTFPPRASAAPAAPSVPAPGFAPSPSNAPRVPSSPVPSRPAPAAPAPSAPAPYPSHPSVPVSLRTSEPTFSNITAPPRSAKSSGGLLPLFLAILLVLGALAGIYTFRPALFQRGMSRIGGLFGIKVAPATAPKAVGPPFDAQAAGVVLGQVAAKADSCRKDGGPVGKGRAQVLYAPDGSASSVAVSRPFHETEAGGCLQDLFSKTRVPAFGGDPVVVSKTFEVK